MKKTGEFLKKSREEKGLSLHEIGLALKINTKVLKAIEEADTKNLPAKTFLRGFVKSYASYLKLDVTEVLNLFAEEMGTTQPQPVLKAEQEPQANTSAKSNTQDKTEMKALGSPNNSTRTIVLVSLGIALVSLILFTKKIVDRYSREAQIENVANVDPITETDSSTTLPQDLLPEESTPLAVTDILPTQLTPAQTSPIPAASSPAGITLAPVVTNESNQVTPQVATKTAEEETEKKQEPTQPSSAINTEKKPEPTKPTDSQSPVEQNKTIVPQKGKNVELIVEAMSAVEIEYSSASGKPTKIRLSPEQVHTFKSKDGLSVKISNGGAVNLIHNGKDLGIPGDLGKPLQLNY